MTQPTTFTLEPISVEIPWKLTEDEAQKFQEYLQTQIIKLAERYVRNELAEGGCWCQGLSHQPDCESWVLPF